MTQAISSVVLRLSHALKPALPFLIATIFLILLLIAGIRRLLIHHPKTILQILCINVLFFLLFSLAALTLAEGYFRYVYDATDNLFFLQTSQAWMQRHVITNSDGYRDREFSGRKKAGVKRIGILGDSYTYGQGIANVEDRFSNLLARRLSLEEPVEVYNLARGGLTTRDQVAALINAYRPVAQYDFDLLLLAYVPNDIRGELDAALLESERRYASIRKTQPLKLLFDHSYAIEFFFFRLTAYRDAIRHEQVNRAAEWYMNPAIWAEHERSIWFLDQFTQSMDTPLAVVILPFLHARNDPSMRAIHEKLIRAFQSRNIPVIDLTEKLQKMPMEELVVNAYDAHPNKRAHAIIADEIATFIQQNRLLEKSKGKEREKSPSLTPPCAPPIPKKYATASAETLLKEGYILPQTNTTDLPTNIRLFRAAWEARIKNRGLWKTCSSL